MKRSILRHSSTESASVQGTFDTFEQEQEEGKFHLILTDVVLPDQTGLDLIDRLHLYQSKLKVLLMSGYTEVPSSVRVVVTMEKHWR